jgi:DtxR family Mn-dependent transcriptional regulator
MPERPDNIPLSSLAAGEAATVVRVKPTDPELLRYLGGLGIYPQVRVTVEAVAPFDGPVTVSVAGQRHAIGQAVAAQIFVADLYAAEAG